MYFSIFFCAKWKVLASLHTLQEDDLKVPQPDSTLCFFAPFILTSGAALVPARKISDKSVSTYLSSLPLFLPFPTLAPLPLDLPLPLDSHFFGAVQTCQMTKNSSGWSLRTEQDCNCPTCLTKTKPRWSIGPFASSKPTIHALSIHISYLLMYNISNIINIDLWAHIYLHTMYIIWYTYVHLTPEKSELLNSSSPNMLGAFMAVPFPLPPFPLPPFPMTWCFGFVESCLLETWHLLFKLMTPDTLHQEGFIISG